MMMFGGGPACRRRRSTAGACARLRPGRAVDRGPGRRRRAAGAVRSARDRTADRRRLGIRVDQPGSIQADNGAGLTKGIIGLVNKGQPRKPDDWGSLRRGRGARRAASTISRPTRPSTRRRSASKACRATARRRSSRWRSTSASRSCSSDRRARAARSCTAATGAKRWRT